MRTITKRKENALNVFNLPKCRCKDTRTPQAANMEQSYWKHTALSLRTSTPLLSARKTCRHACNSTLRPHCADILPVFAVPNAINTCIPIHIRAFGCGGVFLCVLHACICVQVLIVQQLRHRRQCQRLLSANRHLLHSWRSIFLPK